MKKRILLFIISITIYLYCQNNLLQITRLEIVNDKIPDSFNDYKIVQISDYHNTKSKVLNNILIEKIKKEEPNIIVITGDLIDSTNTDINQAISFIKEIKDISPIYYVTGNHETWIDNYKKLEIELKENNVIILNNEVISLEKDNHRINLIGIEDSVSENDANNKINNINYDKTNYNILLSHRPELFNTYIENNIDLVLTGHAHGGQIRIPFVGGLIAPDQGLLPKYTEGIQKKDNTTMIINRGIGNSVIPIRINNHPEMIIITLKNKEE